MRHREDSDAHEAGAGRVFVRFDRLMLKGASSPPDRPGLRLVLTAAALSGAAAFVLATQVYVQFSPIRIRIVRSAVASEAGAVHVGTAGLTRIGDLHPPFAVIARIRNLSPAAATFTILLDGTPVCERSVPAGAAQRVDCVFDQRWEPAVDHHVVVNGPVAAWSFDYLELATHHGMSTRGGTLYVLPAASTPFSHPAPVWIALVWIAWACAVLLPGAAFPRAVAILHTVLCSVIVLVAIVVVASAHISPYAIVLSPQTFAEWSCVLLAPRLWFASQWIWRTTVGRLSATQAQIAASVVVALVVGAAYGTVVHGRLRDAYSGNYSGFLQISRSTFDRNPILNSREDIRRTLVFREFGYDGQFMYFATFDPFLRVYHDRPSMYREVMDAVPYRYGRIGFSLLTKLFSLDQWRRFPATMTWLILAGTGAAALLLALIARENGLNPLWGALIILVPGFCSPCRSACPSRLPRPCSSAGIWRRFVVDG